MIRGFIIVCSVMVCVTATMPLQQSPPDAQKGLVQSSAESIMANKIEQTEYRLPCNTVPHVYIIEIDPNFLGEEFTFKGNATILFEVLQLTTTVTLHRSSRINVEKQATELVDRNGKIKKPVSQKWNLENDFFSMKFSFRLKPGNYSLKMSWSGRDSSDGWYNPFNGLFRAVDQVENGELKYLLITFFEPNAARHLFPCWDEPGKKAQFEFSVTHYQNYTALSNMPVKNCRELSDGKVLTTFERSPMMSSYLACLAVADYGHIENIHGNITFYTLERALDSIQYALDVSEKVIRAMESYTDVPYTFPKLDQITVPQYGAIAMEHWGLVSYVTDSVLVHNDTFLPDIFRSEQVEKLVAHELSHQWFGNLVTPIWWDDVWLNEAFAAYFQYKALETIFPEQRIMDIFVVNYVNERSFRSEDSSYEGKPIKWNPTNEIEIQKMFSRITYDKGAAVLHMLDHILGENIFREGIRGYLKTHQFKAVNTDDLWDGFQKVYNEMNVDNPLNIKETMDPWIKQTGYPIITVTRDNKTGDVILTQKNAKSTDSNNKWRIPLNYATKSNPDFSSTLPTTWFNEDDDNVTIPKIKHDDWIIMNIQQRGFYRVNYDEENWRLVAQYLSSEDYQKIPPINRAQLITDAFRMVRESKVDEIKRLEIFINITSYLHQETDYLPWIPAIEIMREFTKVMQRTPVEEIFNKYILFLMRKIMDHTGDNYTNMKVQQLVFPLACELGHTECRNTAKRIFFERRADLPHESLIGKHHAWIFCGGLEDANETIWDSLFESVNDTWLDLAPYNFLRCSKSEQIRNKYMDRLFTMDVIDYPTETVDVFSMFGKNRENVDYLLSYFINHFELIQEFFNQTDNPEHVTILIAVFNEVIKNRDQYEKFKAFIEPRLRTLKEKFGNSVSETLLEELGNKIDWIDAQLPTFHALMDEHVSGSNATQPTRNVETS